MVDKNAKVLFLATSRLSYHILKKGVFASVNDEPFIYELVENEGFIKISKIMGQQNPLSLVIENVQNHKPFVVSMETVLCFGWDENA